MQEKQLLRKQQEDEERAEEERRKRVVVTIDLLGRKVLEHVLSPGGQIFSHFQ